MSTIGLQHLRLLAVYATVIETGSFAAAARKLGTSRSRVSEQVATLEYVIGVRLLQRSTRQLQITPEGHDVHEQALKLNEVLKEVESITSPTEPSGRVSITMNNDIAHKYFLPVLAGFRERYPAVQLDIILDDERLDLIREQIDLGIRIGFPRDESLVARVLHEERFGIYASPLYLERAGYPSDITALNQHCWILFTQVTKRAAQPLRFQGSTFEVKPREFYRCNSPLMGQQMVAAGLGLGALLPGTVRTEVEQGRLVQIMPEVTSEPLIFSLVYPSRKQVPKRIRALIDYLIDARMFD